MIYDKAKIYWDKIFLKEETKVPKDAMIPIKDLNDGMDWLIEEDDHVLDFGCGNGTLLFYANLKGASKLVGIDISEKGIELAKKRASHMPGDYSFICGDVKELEHYKDNSFDSVILSNIIDNLTEDDMYKVIERIYYLLKKNGRLLLKMNDFINESDFDKYDIKVIDKDLLDDGLLLLNKTTDTWRKILSERFVIEKELTVLFEKYNVKNRMFLLKRKEG